MKVKNLNIATMHNLLYNVDHEARNCVSNGVSHMRAPDVSRCRSYLDELEAYHAHVTSRQPVDWPHAANLSFELKEIPAVPQEFENNSLCEFLHLVKIMDTEICLSQSKDQPSGLVSYDSVRLSDSIGYCRSLLDFVEQSTPTDRPESASSEPTE